MNIKGLISSKKGSFIKVICLMLSVITIGSCTPSLYSISKSNTANNKNQIEAIEQQQYPKPPAVVEQNRAYVDTTPVSLKQEPAWLSRPVTLRGNKLPLSFYVTQIVAGTNVMNHYDDTVDRGMLLSVDFSGTSKNALKYLSNKSNYFYSHNADKNELSWSSLETKVFDISFMPGSVQYQVGQTAGSTALSGGGSSSSSSGSSGGNNGGGYDFSQDTQYSNLSGTVSVWEDITKTIQSLLSKDGKATVSQSTTTVTVHDHPDNVRAIEDYVNKMNGELSRQVRIHVQLIEVQLSKNFNMGINWQLVRKHGHDTFTLSGSGATNAGNTGSFSPVGLTWLGGTGSLWAGTQTLIQALQEQGDVSVLTEPTVTTLNNQVATISLQSQQAYINGYDGGSISNGVAAIPTPELGTVVTGFNLYLLPKIQEQNVFLQISSVLSNLTSLETIDAQTGLPVSTESEGGNPVDETAAGTPAGGSSSASSGTVISTPQVIQMPTVNLRSFNQRSVIPNGATLILAGFKQNLNSADQSKFLNSAILGGTGATTINKELVLLITPVIISTTNNGMNDYGPQ